MSKKLRSQNNVSKFYNDFYGLEDTAVKMTLLIE